MASGPPSYRACGRWANRLVLAVAQGGRGCYAVSEAVDMHQPAFPRPQTALLLERLHERPNPPV